MSFPTHIICDSCKAEMQEVSGMFLNDSGAEFVVFVAPCDCTKSEEPNSAERATA